MTHGAAAAYVVHGADMAAGRQRRREVVAEQLLRARDASVWALFKRRQRLKSGPDIFLFIKIFKHPHFDIPIGDLPDVQILPIFS
jgi:hypothetical protein